MHWPWKNQVQSGKYTHPSGRVCGESQTITTLLFIEINSSAGYWYFHYYCLW